MIEVSRKPRGPAWLIVLPPILFLVLASLTLASARHLYRWRIIRFRNLHLAFVIANELCRIGLSSWRHRRASRPPSQRDF